MNIVSQIHKWNIDRGNTPATENRLLESTMLLEEVFEGLGILNPKETAKNVVAYLPVVPISDVDWLDHLCDIEFILHGSKSKMGLTPQQDVDALQIVVTANKQKSGSKDSEGKIMKDSSFIEPQQALQELIDLNP